MNDKTIKKEVLRIAILVILGLTVLASIGMSSLTKDYNYFLFTIGGITLVIVILSVMLLVGLIIRFGSNGKIKSEDGPEDIRNEDVPNKGTLKNRKFVLSNISEASRWGSANDISNYLVIQENLEFLKSNLCLDHLEAQIRLLEDDNNKDNKLSGFLTSRQMHCMLAISRNVQEKNVQGAYHELYDFIESCKNLDDKAIDMVEKIVIRNAIIQIESVFKES